MALPREVSLPNKINDLARLTDESRTTEADSVFRGSANRTDSPEMKSAAPTAIGNGANINSGELQDKNNDADGDAQ